MPFISDKQTGFIPDTLPLTGFVSDRDAQKIQPQEQPVSMFKETLRELRKAYPSPIETAGRLIRREEKPFGDIPEALFGGIAYETAGIVKGLTLGYVKPEKMLEKFEYFREMPELRKKIAGVGGQVVGALAPISMISKGVGGGLKLLNIAKYSRPFISALAQGGITGGIYGLARNPEEHEARLQNARDDAGLFVLFTAGMFGIDKVIKNIRFGKTKLYNSLRQDIINKFKGVGKSEAEATTVTDTLLRQAVMKKGGWNKVTRQTLKESKKFVKNIQKTVPTEPTMKPAKPTPTAKLPIKPTPPVKAPIVKPTPQVKPTGIAKGVKGGEIISTGVKRITAESTKEEWDTFKDRLEVENNKLQIGDEIWENGRLQGVVAEIANKGQTTKLGRDRGFIVLDSAITHGEIISGKLKTIEILHGDDVQVVRRAKPTPKPTPQVKPTGIAKGVVSSESIIPEKGKSFKFSYIRNLEKSPDRGARFGQNVEPAGRYMTVGKAKNVKDLPNFETGEKQFDNPLIVDFGGGYGEKSNWKNVVSKQFGGKVGTELTKAIKKAGYDGIVTISKSGGKKYTSEILDLDIKKPTPTISQEAIKAKAEGKSVEEFVKGQDKDISKKLWDEVEKKHQVKNINWSKADKEEFDYCTSCVESTAEKIDDLVDYAKEISYNKFINIVGKEKIKELFPIYAWEGKGLKLKDDYSVSYGRGVFENKPAYYIQHSAIEYIFKGKSDVPKSKLLDEYIDYDDFVKENIKTKAKLTDIYNKAGVEKAVKVEKVVVKPVIKKPTVMEAIRKTKGIEDVDKDVAVAYEQQKELWFQDKDVRVFKTKTEKSRLQTELRTALSEKKYTENVKNYDKAIQLYIDTQRNPEHLAQYYNKLSPEQKKIADIAQDLPANVKQIADKISNSYKEIGLEAQEADVIKNVLDNYVNRTWDLSDKQRVELFRKFGTTTRHAKGRVFGTILEGWAKGYKLKVEGATNNLQILKEEMVKTIEDKKFIKSLQKIKTIDGEPLLSTKLLEGYINIEHPNFKIWRWAGEAKEGKTYGRNFFIDEDGNLFERRELYAPKEQARNLNNILGISKLNNIPGVKTITKYNAIVKAWILQSSFFHHLAFGRSYWFGTNHKRWKEMSPRQAYRQGLKAIKEESPIVLLGVKNGLTLGLKQDWHEELLQEKTVIGEILDKTKVTKVIKDKILDLRQAQADFLFGKLGAGLKAKSFMIEYRNLTKKHPEKSADEIAKMAANLINDDFGGLHLQRLGRNPTIQHIFRLFTLAPDWTESNVRSMVKAIRSGTKAETAFYRRFWAGILTKGALITVLANLLLNPDDLWETYKRAWREGKLRWLDVDVTNLYRALGGKTQSRKYFSVFGHFKDPLKFITHPIRSIHHKGSVIYGFFHEALSGIDWAGRRFTTTSELLGVDKEKGEYKTTRKGYYKKGDPKWGKLKGKTVTWDFKGRGPLSYSQLPSFILNQTKGSQPIQIQNLLSWLAGEMEGFDALLKSAGLRVSTTYGGKNTKEATIKRLKAQKRKLLQAKRDNPSKRETYNKRINEIVARIRVLKYEK